MARQLTTKEITLVAIMGFLAIGGGFINFVILPMFNQSAALRTTVDGLELKVNEVRQELRDAAELERKYAESQAELAAFEKSIPEKKELPSLLKELELIAARCDIDLSSINASPPTDKKTHFEVTLSLSVAGKYQDILRFFRELTSAERLIITKSATITPGEGERMTLNIQAATFMRGGTGGGSGQ